MMDVDETSPDFRLDKDWWSAIFALEVDGNKKYPLLGQLIKALLSIFSGPAVEGSFNIMDDIIENDRCALSGVNYEALAFTKSFLSSHKSKAVTHPISEAMINSVGRAYASYQEYLQSDARDTCNIGARPKKKVDSQPALDPTPVSKKSTKATSSSDPSVITSSKVNSPSLTTATSTSTVSLPKTTATKPAVHDLAKSSTSAVSNAVTGCHNNHNHITQLPASDPPSLQTPSNQPLPTSPESVNVKQGTKRKQLSLASFFVKKPKLNGEA